MLLRLAKGRTRWSVDGRTLELRENHVLIVLPGQVFSGIEASESTPIRVERVELELPRKTGKMSAAALSKYLPMNRPEAGLIIETLAGMATPVARLNSEAVGRFSGIVRDARARSPLAQLHLRAGFLHLLTSVCLALRESEAPDGDGASGTEVRVAAFLAELESRCPEDWTLEGMAESSGLKRSRFGGICRQLTGETPGTYLNRLRIRLSRKLLRDTRLSVTQIAFECGFGSSQYFAKTFRRFQGHEPSHYRVVSREIQEGGGIHYVKGDSARILATANREVGEGDFRIEGEISLDRLGGTAASLEFGRDRFGFDGREGRFFLEGVTFGNARFFQRSAEVIREGIPFSFKLERSGKQLEMTVKGKVIVALHDEPRRRIGAIGLRPLRNGIHVVRFEIDGEAVVLSGGSRT